ncbi:MAG: hypothetical protein V3V96_10655 [Acidiferrobacterales bacterium]
MSGSEWIGLGAVALTLIIALMGAAAWIAGRLGATNTALLALQKSVDKLGERFDRAPCSEHAKQMAVIERRLNNVEGE